MIDLNAMAMDKYEAAGEEKARGYQANDGVTTAAGAKVEAACVVLGILGLKEDGGLGGNLKQRAKEEAEKAVAGE